MNTQLVVIEHFDFLINELDIFVEGLLKEASQDDGKQRKGRKKTISKRIDSINEARSRLIDEIRGVEDIVMKYCEKNRVEIKKRLVETLKTDDLNAKKEAIKNEVFENTSSCFLVYLNRDELRSNVCVSNQVLNVFLVLVERVYLDSTEIKFIR